MVIKDDASIDILKDFQMNSTKTGLVSELVMDGGEVNVTGRTYVNNKGNTDSQADFTLNGGTWNSKGHLSVGATPNGGNANLTINGGTMETDGYIWVGDVYSGRSRIFLNGGLLRCEGLAIKQISDSRIVYRGGELWINKFAMDEAAMQDFITAGMIDATADYEITTIGDYTVLRLPAI
jgi:hypothetical protein